MARQKEVIEERKYMTESFRWYRQIGMHRYRFTVRRGVNGVTVIAEMAIAKRDWETRHWIELP